MADPASVGLLANVLATDDDEMNRALAVRYLGDLRNDEAIARLTGVPDTEPRSVLIQMASALGKNPVPSGLKRLGDLLMHRDEKVQDAAVSALKRVDDPVVFEVMLVALDHERPSIRTLAADYLAESGDPRSVSAIEDRLSLETGLTQTGFRALLIRAREVSGQRQKT